MLSLLYADTDTVFGFTKLVSKGGGGEKRGFYNFLGASTHPGLSC